MTQSTTGDNGRMKRAGDGRALAPDPPRDAVERMYTCEQSPERAEAVELATMLVRRVPTGTLLCLLPILSRFVADADPLELAKHLHLMEPARRRG